MFDGHWRAAVDRGTKPVGEALRHAGLSADVITAAGLLMSVAAAISIGSGRLLLGAGFLALTGLCDLLDGPVAKAAGTSSIRGAFFDSVADRVSDAFLFGGVAWELASTHRGHLALLPFAVLAATSFISYQRAKAESLGIQAKGGLMERAERILLLGVGLIFSSALIPVLWLLLALVTATAVGRFARIWSAANGLEATGLEAVTSEAAATVGTVDATEVQESPSSVDSLHEQLLDPGLLAPAGSAGSAGLLAYGNRVAGGSGSEEMMSPLLRWRRGHVDSRWRTWRQARIHRDGTAARPATHRRVGEPLGRWRSRREVVSTTRTNRAWRTRRDHRPHNRERAGRRLGPRDF